MSRVIPQEIPMKNTPKPSAQEPDKNGLLWWSIAQEMILYPEDKNQSSHSYYVAQRNT